MTRSSPRVLVPLLAIALLLALSAQARAQGATPMVLLLHGGGWSGGSAASMNAWREDFEAHGYRTRALDYPLRSVTRSIEYVDAIAQNERVGGTPVIAYGISAGGTIAAALAATGRVDGAVDVIGPTDLAHMLSPLNLPIILGARMRTAEMRSASPLRRLNGNQSPQLLQCGLADPLTTYEQCSRYVSAARQGNPDTTLHTMVNLHYQGGADRDRARAWVQAHWPAGSRR